MYVPPAFAVSDPVEVRTLVESAGAGHLVTTGPGGLQATLLPLLVDDGLTVARGHLARANPHARALLGADGPVEALVIVPGPDGYVSPDRKSTRLNSSH